METEIFIGLGANVGNRIATMGAALDLLLAGGCNLIQRSSLYETPPWGLTEQPPFVNQVVQVASLLGPMEVLELAMAVEQALGRERRVRWGPRTIDIDVLAYGKQSLDRPELTIPHPRLAERAFVLVPWAEIAADYLPPGFPVSIGQLVGRLAAGDKEAVRRL